MGRQYDEDTGQRYSVDEDTGVATQVYQYGDEYKPLQTAPGSVLSSLLGSGFGGTAGIVAPGWMHPDAQAGSLMPVDQMLSVGAPDPYELYQGESFSPEQQAARDAFMAQFPGYGQVGSAYFTDGTPKAYGTPGVFLNDPSKVINDPTYGQITTLDNFGYAGGKGGHGDAVRKLATMAAMAVGAGMMTGAEGAAAGGAEAAGSGWVSGESLASGPMWGGAGETLGGIGQLVAEVDPAAWAVEDLAQQAGIEALQAGQFLPELPVDFPELSTPPDVPPLDTPSNVPEIPQTPPMPPSDGPGSPAPEVPYTEEMMNADNPPISPGTFDQMKQFFQENRWALPLGIMALGAMGGSGGSGGAPAGAGGGSYPVSNYRYTPGAQGQSGRYTKLAGGGGISGLAGGGEPRMVRGPGDGVSDSVPAMIQGGQPAALADGEFVIPARIVSELGNGSTDAGAKRLYAMMDRVQKARGKTVGKGRSKVAVDSKAHKALPA